MNAKYVVIVDPYSSAVFFPKVIKEHGLQCIAVHTSLPENSGLAASFQAEDFAYSLVFQESVEHLAKELLGFNIVAVMPGVETGVLLADDLASALGLPRNDYQYSRARRDKYKMQQTISAAGIRSIRSTETASFEQALQWAYDNDLWPLVVKPVDSGGSDCVRRCDNEQQLRDYFHTILGARNFFGSINSTVLVQEYVTGTEYVVDAVSANGRHYSTNLVEYKKQVYNNSIIYDTLEFTAPEGEIAKELIRYNDAVLDALGIVIGPSHSEIMLTEDGPVLIEVGARISGGKVSPMVVEECAVNSLIKLSVECFVNPDLFKLGLPEQNVFNKRAVGMCFRNEKAGLVKSIPGLDVLKRLPSLFNVQVFVKEGQQVQPTHDLYTSPAWVVLINDDNEQLRKDFDLVKSLNANQGMLEVV